jgi:2-phospho-L-lactate guanylyltransferase
VVADDDHAYAADLTIRQGRAGLNGALDDGADYAAGRWPDDGVAALVGDLPALRPEELGAALDAAAAHPEAFVRDADGTGTTLLTAAGAALRPRFGPGSARAHADDGAVPLSGTWPGLLRDVDTEADLRAALALGTGPRTAALAVHLPAAP